MRRVDGYPLWLGNVGDVRRPAELLSAGIQAVVELAANETPAQLPRDLLHCRFPLVDGAGNPPWLLRAAITTVTSLLDSQTPTLIYCGAGMSRTPAIAAAAVAMETGAAPGDALKQITLSGPHDVSPSLWAEVTAAVAALRSDQQTNRCGTTDCDVGQG
jgi:hypothetical protein